jgi:two-component system CheB/CheR fusion protein
LQDELEETRTRLQTTIEEYETSKEEMRAANEELQSMNEELRSTAEELETSKEELQSINEEMVTVNQENKHKVEELSQVTSDLQNLLSSTEIATLFLDRELRIKRFTPRVGEIFNVLSADRGRPIAHITHKLGYSALLQEVDQVLRTLVPIETEVRSESGRWYIMRLLPYRTTDDRIDGVVLTFVDVTERKYIEGVSSESSALLRLALDAGDVHTWEWWPDEARFVINPPAGIFGSVREASNDDFWALIHEDDRADVRAAFLRAAEERTPLAVEYRPALTDGRADGKEVWLALRGHILPGPRNAPLHYAGIFFDVSRLMPPDPSARGRPASGDRAT